MKALIYDTETTGMVEFKKPADHPGQPDLIQLAFVLIDADSFVQIASFCSIVRPGWGYEIHPKAFDAHKISKEKIDAYGMETSAAMTLFEIAYGMADIQIGHNFDFDRRVIETARFRSHVGDGLKLTKPKLCTMRKSIKPVGAKWADGRVGKYPTLSEAYRHFTGKNLDGAHDALVDVHAARDVLKGLVDSGEVNLKEIVLGG